MAASARGKQRTDSTHVLAKIRAINRLVCGGETLRHALNCLAIVAASRGCSIRACPSGWIAMGYGWKTRVCLPEKKIVRPGLKWVGKMEACCSAPCLIRVLPHGYEKCLR